MIFLKKKNKEHPTEENSSPKHHFRKYVFIFLSISILIIAAAIYRFAQKPAEGVIKPPSKDIQAADIGNDVPESFMGKYVSFMYGNKYALKSHEISENSADIILETAYFSESLAISKKINLTIRNLPSRNLEDVPDYKMREMDTKRYRKETFSEGKINGESFVPADDSQFEKTFFIQHDDLLAIIVITASALPDDALNKEANAIAKSLEWLK